MQPLRDLKVLDFTSLLPGPMATLYLADWGADVLRLEAPEREDLSRQMPPFANGTSTTHAFLNRSKQSLCLDLKLPKSKQIIVQLLATYDVIVEGFRPGVMQKLGLDYATLAAHQPRLIYCSLTGYGQSGPLRDRAGHDVNYAALTGLSAMTGTKAHGPVLHGNPICDLTGSMHAVIGILMAAYHREKTGTGQYIDVSLSDASLMQSALWAQMALVTGHAPSWEDTPLNGATFYGYYRTKDQRYLSVGGLEPKFLHGFLEAIGSLDLLPRLAAEPDHAGIVRQKIQDRLLERTMGEWMDIFQHLDICVEPVLSLEEVVKHPQFLAREM
ncbi:MAG: CaiB/BaiF CoA transferase family protein, partial [Oligoflexus sp.]